MEMKLLSLTNSGTAPAAFEILRETLRRHLGVRSCGLAGAGEAAFELSVRTDPASLPHEGRYIIESDGRRAVISAADTAAVFAGLGRFLEESRFDGRGGFEPFAGRIDFTPARPLRGMYFATHFQNFYHNAPIGRVYEVIEDLALRGCNSLLVWFDMHHFASMDDPEAVRLTERLRAMIGYANRIGITGSLTMLSNEGFSSSPQELRAEWTAQNGYTAVPDGHYHVEICPSKPGGIREILRERRAMLERFADLDIKYVCYWPYDQGGCTCEKCAPWGAGGFLRLFPHFRDLIKELMPDTGIILSTWYFDKFTSGEWDAFYPRMTDGTLSGVDYVMSFFHGGNVPRVIRERGIPRGIRMIDFPEISMHGCMPWGGFGASALPGFLGRTNAASGAFYSGGYPYSEGIFEDVNKYYQLSFYSGLHTDPRDAVRAYVRYEFCASGEAEEELADAIIASEKTLTRTADRSGPSVRFVMDDPSEAGRIYSTFARYGAGLPEKISKSPKFRMWYLRAVIDRELASCGGYPLRSEICTEAMRELEVIYHTSAGTRPSVRPPLGY